MGERLGVAYVGIHSVDEKLEALRWLAAVHMKRDGNFHLDQESYGERDDPSSLSGA